MSLKISSDCFGEIDEGTVKRKIKRFTISNHFIELQVMEYGATITSLKCSDKFGNVDDIVLGYDNLTDYLNGSYYFGCVIGRFANRISKAQFKLNGKQFSLVANNGPNHLHGGLKGFDKVIWIGEKKPDGVEFSYFSPSMEENYPGDLRCTLNYQLTDQNELIIHYRATTNEATPINLTNHSYFNLAGHGSGDIFDHVISINSDRFIQIDEKSIPTGEVQSVSSTRFDLRKSQRLGLLMRLPNSDYDHCFCVNGNIGTLRKAASIHHPNSGRLMDVYSTQPGVQFYTANLLPEDNTLHGKNGQLYKKHGAICLETQNYPDAINQENFPKAFLEKGELYQHTTKLVFSLK